jgi:hypothetical protein
MRCSCRLLSAIRASKRVPVCSANRAISWVRNAGEPLPVAVKARACIRAGITEPDIERAYRYAEASAKAPGAI